ncbi:hypothetical protein PHLCEN_2v12643 [Hermanssonia centrifuga]|uniref:Uncharacterized protein n=1 Tax=Hermanssonia centrifuga TaxID=98765 RepID=A0A2R6NGV7_9APHY|nr:hypothetical protein PHLCEN_2v12643 [Hermanssonia centrifuga]
MDPSRGLTAYQTGVRVANTANRIEQLSQTANASAYAGTVPMAMQRMLALGFNSHFESANFPVGMFEKNLGESSKFSKSLNSESSRGGLTFVR